MVAMSYFCRQNVSQISLEIVTNCSHPSEILALAFARGVTAVTLIERLNETEFVVFQRV